MSQHLKAPWWAFKLESTIIEDNFQFINWTLLSLKKKNYSIKICYIASKTEISLWEQKVISLPSNLSWVWITVFMRQQKTIDLDRYGCFPSSYKPKSSWSALQSLASETLAHKNYSLILKKPGFGLNLSSILCTALPDRKSVV